jgi:hypothetical protein
MTNTEFHNQKNGGSFMNRLFKASAMLAILAASAIIMSCGSDGKDGARGGKGTDCRAEQIAGGEGFNVICGSQIVYTVKNGPQGPQGQPGPDGEDCYLELDATGNYEVMCEEGLVGRLYTVVDGSSEGSGCDLLTVSDTLLSIKCADSEFAMALCGGQTYNMVKSFCSYFTEAGALAGSAATAVPGESQGFGMLIPRCNGAVYDLRAEYCARNLVIGMDRMIVEGPALIENPLDVDTAKPASANWKVLRKTSGSVSTIMKGGIVTAVTSSDSGYFAAATADTCFYQRGADAPVIKGCSEFSVVTSTKYSAHKDIANISGDPTTYGLIFNACRGNTSTDASQPLQYFDLTLERCVNSTTPTTTVGGCAIVLIGENTCYSDATTDVPNTKAFVRACTVDSKPLYYDPITVTSCDEKWKNPELALTCAGEKSFSSTLYTYAPNTLPTTGAQGFGINGQTIAKRIYCVDRVVPTECKEGSGLVESGSRAGTCAMADSSKIPWCPSGYVFGDTPAGQAALGIKPDADAKYLYGGYEGDDPRDYCVKAVEASMCPQGTTVDLGRCLISAAGKSVATVPFTLNGTAYSYAFYPSSSSATSSNSVEAWLGKGVVFWPNASNYSSILCAKKGGVFDKGKCHYLVLTGIAPTDLVPYPPVYKADAISSTSNAAKCPSHSKLMLASLDSVKYKTNGSIERGTTWALGDPDAEDVSWTISDFKSTGWPAEANRDNEINDIGKVNQNMIKNGLSYDCVVEYSSASSDMRCPQGSYATTDGWCEKTLQPAIDADNPVVKDSIRPSCPVGFAPMFTNAGILDINTGVGTGYYIPSTLDNRILQIRLGVADFPHFNSPSDWLSPKGTTNGPRQVCAQILTNDHCDNKETILYRVQTGKDDYGPLVSLGGSADGNGVISFSGGKWSSDDWDTDAINGNNPFKDLAVGGITTDITKGTIGRICLPTEVSATDVVSYKVSDSYDCPSVTTNKATHTGTGGVYYPSANASGVYGCFIDYNNVSNTKTLGLNLCQERDVKYTFDVQLKECKLLDEFPVCQENSLIDGIAYKFGVKDPTAGLSAKQTFQACAVLIENSFCPMNRTIAEGLIASGYTPSAAMAQMANPSSTIRNINMFDNDDERKQSDNGVIKRCRFNDGDGWAGCKPGFTLMKPGVGNSWCEGVL